jgi:hypothetical protein
MRIIGIVGRVGHVHGRQEMGERHAEDPNGPVYCARVYGQNSESCADRLRARSDAGAFSAASRPPVAGPQA